MTFTISSNDNNIFFKLFIGTYVFKNAKTLHKMYVLEHIHWVNNIHRLGYHNIILN